MRETYHSIFAANEPIVIKNDKPARFEFCVESNLAVNKKHRLFFKGESALFYLWRTEPDCTGEYACIDDSLTNEGTHTDCFRLNYSSETPVKYRKTAYKKITWQPVLHWGLKKIFPDDFKFGIYLDAKNLKIEKDGFLSFRAEVFYKQEVDLESFASKPNKVYTIDFKDGDYDFQKFEQEICLPNSRVDHVDFLLCGEGYSGEVYFEHPFLISENITNLLPDFAPIMPAHERFAWIGINLSKKEWPQFNILLNGKTVFDGEMFEKCHRFSDFELPIPQGYICEGKNTLEIHTKDTYKIPFSVNEVGYFCQYDGDVSIEACPLIVRVGQTAKVLITTKFDNTTVSFKTENHKLRATAQNFKKAGLNVFEIDVLESGVDLAFEIAGISAKFTCAVDKIDDEILVGSGDMIYINHEIEEQVESYLTWYLRNDIGNFITFRNVYRWGGGRKLNPVVWQKTTEILNALGMRYVHIVDGRNLPGSHCNPSLEMLKGKCFLGRQGHEYDGQVGYWGSKDITNNFTQTAVGELWGHVPRENLDIFDPRLNQNAIVREGDKVYMYKKPNTASDMKSAHDVAIEGLKRARLDMTRHTGPASWYKYIYESGFEWAGAELMYSSHELLSAALRGANYGYDKEKMGAHLAVQWSTTPHDDEYRYRRFRLGLYLSYLNGYTDINTEEGLWHLEEMFSSFSRNSDACLNHIKQQQDFYHFTQLNERRGRYQAPFAFVHGRYDGWNAFSSDSIWGQKDFKCSDAERSWELLKEFYPLSRQTSSYQFPCHHEPIGHYSGTPHGNVDIVPIETHKFDKYKVLCFAGYNKMETEDCDAIMSFLKNGGRVIMGKCHMTVTTERADIVNGNLEFLNHSLLSLVEESKNGEDVVVIPVGLGELTFIDREEYPANPAVNSLYLEAIRKYRNEIKNEQPVKISCDETVQYAIYRDVNDYDVYLLAVDWYAEKDYNRKVILNGITVELPFGTLIKVRISENTMAYTNCENAVVTDINDNFVTVKGFGKGSLTVIKNGNIDTRIVDFKDDSLIKITI